MLDESALRGRSLCVVGNINRDVKTSPMPGGSQLLADGETPVGSIVETIGGGGANSAFAAAALGAKITFIGRVGTDALGQRLEHTLHKNGLGARLARDPVNPSGTSLALTFEDGHRHFVSSLPANAALAIGDIDHAAVTACEHLLRADVWFSESMLFEGNKSLFQAARNASVPVSLDLNWDPCWGRAATSKIAARKKAVRDVLPWVSLAHGNVRELTEFADAPDLDTALRRIAEWGAESVVVHLGAKGAGFYEKSTLLVEPPVPSATHVHATGTGDVLSVCMMLLHRHAAAPSEKLRLANTIVSQFIEGRRQLIPPLAD